MALRSELEENPYVPPINENAAAQEFDRRDQFESEEDYLEAVKVWPRCPKCGRRRITRCPICKTSSDLFPLGDSAFWDRSGEEERADDDAGKECGHGCCHSCKNRHDDYLYDEKESNSTLDGEIFPGVPSPRRIVRSHEKTSEVFDDLPEKREREEKWNETEVPVALCHICSEAFTPKFPRICEWCGYDFGNGIDPSEFEPNGDANGVAEFLQRQGDGPNEDDEANPARVLLTVVILGALVLGMLIYLSVL